MTDTSTAVDPWAIRNPDALASSHPCFPTEDPYEDGPWGKRCTTHGLPWTSAIGCEVAQRRARAERGEQAAILERDRRRKAEASRAGLLSLVEVGVTVYSSTHRRRTADGEVSIGGVIVEEALDVDRDTGDMEKRWTVLDLHERPVAVRVVTENEVKAAGVEATNLSTIARLIFRLAEEIEGAGRGKDRRLTRTMVDTRTLDRIRWMGTLARLYTGGGR